MPVIIPNLDRITKDDVKTGEALKKVQDYLNAASPIVVGNAVTAPPSTSTPPASTTTTTPKPGSNPAVKPPPHSNVPDIA